MTRQLGVSARGNRHFGKVLYVLLCMVFVSMLVVYWAIDHNAHHAFNIAARIPVLGWFVAHGLRPPDYFIPLAEAPLTVGECKVDFKFKYVGRHEIQIWPIVNDTLFKNSVGMQVSIEAENGGYMFMHEQNHATLLGGEVLDGEKTYNYCYAIVDVPQDLPVDVKLTAKIKCWGNVSDVKRLNPNAKVVMRKMADK